jgi:uncharacterized protein (DUF302 family)
VTYGTTTRMALPFADAVDRVRAALAEQGFGILTEIDVRATMKNKLDTDMEDYVILGACNPPLAHRALTADRDIGLLLPCNVVVRGTQGGTVVEVLDPHIMVPLAAQPEIEEVADEAGRRLDAVLAALAS